jgi:hypothetical protein
MIPGPDATHGVSPIVKSGLPNIANEKTFHRHFNLSSKYGDLSFLGSSNHWMQVRFAHQDLDWEF